MELIEAIQSGDIGAVRQCLQTGADVNERDAQGWTALNWASAAGDAGIVNLLLQFGADATSTGTDQRTPAMIALAAGKAELARVLLAAEHRADESRRDPDRKYCLAVRIGEVRKFPGYESAGIAKGLELHEGAIVYLQQNYTVTTSFSQDSTILFDQVTREWKQFCETQWKFHVPNDFELVSV